MKHIKTLLERHRSLLLLLIVGLLLRMFVISFPPFKSDMDSFIAWGEQLHAVGFSRFYSSGMWTDYAPGYFYILSLIATVKHAFFNDISREQYELIHKLVSILFDLGVGVFIYLIVTAMGRSLHSNPTRIALISAAIYFISPFTFFNSAIWGQVDSVFTFFLLAACLALIKRRMAYAGSLYMIACLIKPQAVIVSPAFAVYIFSEFNRRQFFTLLSSALITFFAVLYPFFGINSVARLYQTLQGSIGTYPYGSINTFNVWGIYGFWKPDTTPYAFGLTQQQFGSLAFFSLAIILFGFFLVVSWKRSAYLRFTYFTIYSSLLVLLGVLLLTRMHERYLHPFFPLALLGFACVWIFSHTAHLSLSAWSRVYYVLYLVLVLLHTLNLYYVYTYYQYFSSGGPLDNQLFSFVSSSITFLSLLHSLITLAYTGFMIYSSLRIRRSTHE